jgi:hypothetical protein
MTTPPPLEDEIAVLRRRVRRSEAQSHAAREYLEGLRRAYAFDLALVRIALLAMVAANAMAFAWARG